MAKRHRKRFFVSLDVPRDIFCLALIGVALVSLFLVIARVGEGPTVRQTAIALLLICLPLACLRACRAS